MANLPAKDGNGALVYISATGDGTNGPNAYKVTHQVADAAGNRIDPATEETLELVLLELQGQAQLADTQPVSMTSIPLAPGASTEANQTTTNTTLSSILTELQGQALLSETQPVSLATIPLATNAATSTLQTSGNASLTTIAGAVVSSKVQAEIVNIPTVKIDDGGNIITIDGAVSVSGISGTVSLPTGASTSALQTSGNASLTTIAGAISGTEMQVDVVTLPLPTDASTATLQTSGNTSLTKIAGAVSGTEMQVDIVSAPTLTVSGTVAVTGVATSALQTSGNASLTTIAGAVVSSKVQAEIVNTPTVKIDDGGNTITVDGTVAISGISGTVSLPTDASTATLQTSGNTSLTKIAGAVSGSEMQVDIVTLPLPTDASTATLQTSGNTLITGVNDRIGATSDAAATSPTGTFSLNALVKRYMARCSAPRLFVTPTIGASGDTSAITAPGAGVRLVITYIRAQNLTANATTILFKDGSAGSTVLNLRTSGDGNGVTEFYPLGEEIRLSAATAFVINQSGANNHIYTIRYFLETVATGLPV